MNQNLENVSYSDLYGYYYEFMYFYNANGKENSLKKAPEHKFNVIAQMISNYECLILE